MTNHSLCLVGGSDGLVHKLWVHANNARLQIRDCFFFYHLFIKIIDQCSCWHLWPSHANIVAVMKYISPSLVEYNAIG